MRPGRADDAAIWEYASFPKIPISCTSTDVEGVLQTAFSVIMRFVNDEDETCLGLSRQGKSKP
jgi:hypothetical protein